MYNVYLYSTPKLDDFAQIFSEHSLWFGFSQKPRATMHIFNTDLLSKWNIHTSTFQIAFFANHLTYGCISSTYGKVYVWWCTVLEYAFLFLNSLCLITAHSTKMASQQI